MNRGPFPSYEPLSIWTKIGSHSPIWSDLKKRSSKTSFSSVWARRTVARWEICSRSSAQEERQCRIQHARCVLSPPLEQRRRRARRCLLRCRRCSSISNPMPIWHSSLVMLASERECAHSYRIPASAHGMTALHQKDAVVGARLHPLRESLMVPVIAKLIIAHDVYKGWHRSRLSNSIRKSDIVIAVAFKRPDFGVSFVLPKCSRRIDV